MFCLFLRENEFVEETVRGKAFLEGCTMKHKQQLEELLQSYRDVFSEPKGLLLKREVEHEIQLLLDSCSILKGKLTVKNKIKIDNTSQKLK